MATGCGRNKLINTVCVVAGSISATQISFSFLTSVQDGFSPVFVASQNGHTEVVDLLVQAGADIHLATTEVHLVHTQCPLQ